MAQIKYCCPSKMIKNSLRGWTPNWPVQYQQTKWRSYKITVKVISKKKSGLREETSLTLRIFQEYEPSMSANRMKNPATSDPTTKQNRKPKKNKLNLPGYPKNNTVYCPPRSNITRIPLEYIRLAAQLKRALVWPQSTRT